MADPEMHRLTARVTEAAAQLERAQAELATYAAGRTRETQAFADCDQVLLADVAAAVTRFLGGGGGQWHTRSLARAVAQRMQGRISARTLETVYLPALRRTSPHCVQSGREWLWYWDAAKSRQEAF